MAKQPIVRRIKRVGEAVREWRKRGPERRFIRDRLFEDPIKVTITD